MRLNGYALREFRQRSDRTVTECAKAIGVTQATWSNWERGKRGATPANVLAMSHTLGLSDHRAIVADPEAVDMTELAS